MTIPSTDETYEYAGFQYWVKRDAQGKVNLTPCDGQHPAASKDKHRRAAMECYADDQKAKR
jgi:hypothetical protein